MLPINGLDILVGLVVGVLFLAGIARIQGRVDRERRGGDDRPG